MPETPHFSSLVCYPTSSPLWCVTPLLLPSGVLPHFPLWYVTNPNFPSFVNFRVPFKGFALEGRFWCRLTDNWEQVTISKPSNKFKSLHTLQRLSLVSTAKTVHRTQTSLDEKKWKYFQGEISFHFEKIFQYQNRYIRRILWIFMCWDPELKWAKRQRWFLKDKIPISFLPRQAY